MAHVIPLYIKRGWPLVGVPTEEPRGTLRDLPFTCTIFIHRSISSEAGEKWKKSFDVQWAYQRMLRLLKSQYRFRKAFESFFQVKKSGRLPTGVIDRRCIQRFIIIFALRTFWNVIQTLFWRQCHIFIPEEFCSRARWRFVWFCWMNIPVRWDRYLHAGRS